MATRFEVPQALARLVPILLLAGLLLGCGKGGATNASPHDVVSAAAAQPIPHQVRLRITHRTARYRHAGPR